MSQTPLTYLPIGVFCHPEQHEKKDAPRQGVHAGGEGFVQLERVTGYQHALDGLDEWPRLWLLFHFDQASGFRPTVWPPRSAHKRGVFATRSPHRPNAIGMTAARLVRVDHDALRVYVAEADLLQGTPILDLKPYVAYADAFPDAGSGWLTPADPLPPWTVRCADQVERALAWLAERGVLLHEPLIAALALGPTPQPYRRIRKRDHGLELALKEWRFDFTVDETSRTLTVQRVRSGYRPAQLATDESLALHRAFVDRRP